MCGKKNMAAKVAQTHMHDHVATCTQTHNSIHKMKTKNCTHIHKEHATCLGHARLKPEVHMLFVKKHTHRHTHTYIYI